MRGRVKERFSLEKGWSLCFAVTLTMLFALIFAGWSAVPTAFADEQQVVYNQSDGYEPYQGWQDSPWDEASDPWYSGSGGTTRKGYPGWSLADPLSIGVTGYHGGMVTGSSVKVVNDRNATDVSGAGSFADPYYYKNIILEPYDVSQDTISFTFNYVGAGGVNLTYTLATDTPSGFIIATTPNPEDWNANDDPMNWVASDKVVWEADATNTTLQNTSDNWWKNVVCTVDTSVLEADQTYYLVIKNGTAGQWARIYADIVFEFSTNTERVATWSGDLSKAGYGTEQGNGGTKLGITSPAQSDLTVDLTQIDTCWDNNVAEPLALDENNAVSFIVHADGSGSNWQTISSWSSNNQIKLYDENPIGESGYDVSGIQPIATCPDGIACTLVNEERDWPSLDGVNVTLSDLQSGKEYWLVFTESFKPGNATNPLKKPIVVHFATEDAPSVDGADISAAQDGSLIASLADGTLTISGTGQMMDFASASETPWAQLAADITSVSLPSGLTSIGTYAFAGLDNEALSRVAIPSSVTSVGASAFAGDSNLLLVDMTGCSALASVGANAFEGLSEGSTLYVADATVAALMSVIDAEAGTGNVSADATALVVANGGALAADAEPAASTLLPVALDGYTFVAYTSDSALMHPESSWKALSSGTMLFAKFNKTQVVVDPVEYPGAQGLDQNVTLVDQASLPSTVVKQPGILFYGEDDEHFDNRISEAYNGNKDIVFAFNMARGNNANGGDGSYAVSFSVPFISILNEAGETVADYQNGAGQLKLYDILFDGNDTASTGNTIYAIKVGVDAGTLDEGTYTLRFGSGLGSNNGKSFLGKNVDFQFKVERPAGYTLEFDTTGETAVVTGITVSSDEAVDVVVPSEYDGKTVASIAASAFADTALVASVTVPESVEGIGASAFSAMPDLSWVKVLSQDAEAPVWGEGAFANSPSTTLYGYSDAATVVAAADQADNVTFCPIDDGVTVNGLHVESGDSLTLTKAAPYAEVVVWADGENVTDMFTGTLSNTGVATHAATTGRDWGSITAVANGATDLTIRAKKRSSDVVLHVTASGFDADASDGMVDVTSAQGNGSTIALVSVNDATAHVKTYVADENVAWFDNYVSEQVDATQAQLTLQLGGPGSAWGIDRWDWDEWTSEHLNPYISLLDADGKTIASIGSGLTWITLTDSNSITLGIDAGVMTPDSEYTLVAGADVTGHNTSAKLLKAVHWTFTAKATDVASLAIAAIDDVTYDGSPATPTVEVSATVPGTSLWSTASGGVVTTDPSTRKLVQDVDYTLSYVDNEAVGTAQAVVSGMGDYTGEQSKEFQIVSAGIDTTELAAAISAARDLLNATPVSANGKDVPNGASYASSEANAAFAQAIAAAQLAVDDPNLVEATYEAAKTALASATDAFNAALSVASASKDALNEAIAAAQNASKDVVSSEDGSELSAGVDWATPASIEQLAAVVERAQGVADDNAASQNEIDEACAALVAATKQFVANKNTANPSTVQLSAAIASSSAALQDVFESADGADVAQGKSWAPPAARAALNEAIQDATDVMKDTTASQDAIDAALNALNNAKDAFDAATEVADVDTSALEEACDNASKLRAATKISPDGSDVLTTDTWVTSDAADAFDAAILAARQKALAAGRTKNSIDAAIAELAAATSAFNEAAAPGSVLDVEPLKQAIESAQEELDNAIVSDDASTVPAGKKYVSQSAYAAYEAAVREAADALASAATQDEIDTALDRLAAAKQAFAAAKQDGALADPSSGQGESTSGQGGSGESKDEGSQTGSGSLNGSKGNAGSTQIAATGDSAAGVFGVLITLLVAAGAMFGSSRKSKIS